MNAAAGFGSLEDTIRLPKETLRKKDAFLPTLN
jgi:hypothetical protein